MRPGAFLPFLAILIAPTAHAYLPPAFYFYAKLAEQKGKATVQSVTLGVSRPQAAGTEEALGSVTIVPASGTRPPPGAWPAMSVLFESDPDALIRAVQAFGLSVAKETDLLRVSREQLNAMKEPPRPVYKADRTMSLQRSRQTYAWVHGNKESGKSVWAEKDTYLPLKIAAPCPEAATNLSWAKAGDNKCELEFRNLYALRRGNFQSARFTLWKDGAPLLFFNVERLGPARTGAPEDKLSPDVKEIAETIFH